jgi:hypothetical protein
MDGVVMKIPKVIKDLIKGNSSDRILHETKECIDCEFYVPNSAGCRAFYALIAHSGQDWWASFSHGACPVDCHRINNFKQHPLKYKQQYIMYIHNAEYRDNDNNKMSAMETVN